MSNTNPTSMNAKIKPDTKTIEILDRFEGKTAERVRYDRMMVNSGSFVIVNRKAFCYTLILERSGQKTSYAGECTFTKFKKGWQPLTDYIQDELAKAMTKDILKSGSLVRFSKPWLLRAQNSSNRAGYGWEWDWRDGVGTVAYEGTQYGETTEYVFSSIVIERAY